jgi:hypothetical protein
MIDISPPEVVNYFEANWWSCPDLWAAYSNSNQSLHVTTTNHAESFHNKIKMTLSAKTPLNQTISGLLRLNSLLAKECGAKTPKNQMSRR